jgi:hypothetical protein
MMAEQAAKEGSGPEARLTSEPTKESERAKGQTHLWQAEHLKEEALELWHRVTAQTRKPSVGATIAGAAVLAAGALWGATEAAMAAVAAYMVFRMLRKRARSGQEQEPAEVESRRSSPAQAT